MKKITDQHIHINTTNSPRGTPCDVTYDVDPDNQYETSGTIYVSGNNGITNIFRFGEDSLFSSGNHSNTEQTTSHVIQYYPSGISDTYLNLYDANDISFPRWHNLDTGIVSSTNNKPIKNISALLTNSVKFQDFMNSNTGLMVVPTGGILRVLYSGAAISSLYASEIIPIEMPVVSLEIHKNVETDHFLDYSIDYDVDYTYLSDPVSPTRNFIACRNYVTKKDFSTEEGTYGKDYAENPISSEQIIKLPNSGLLPNTDGSGIINIDYHLYTGTSLGKSPEDMIGGLRRWGNEIGQGQTGKLAYEGKYWKSEPGASSNPTIESVTHYNGTNQQGYAISPIYTAYPDFEINVDTYVNKIIRHKETLSYKGVSASVTQTTGAYDGHVSSLGNFAITGMLTLKGGEVKIQDLRQLIPSRNESWFGWDKGASASLRSIHKSNWEVSQYAFQGVQPYYAARTTDNKYYVDNPNDTNTSGLFIVPHKETADIEVVEKRFTNDSTENSEWRTRPTNSSQHKKFIPGDLEWTKVNNNIYNNSNIKFQTLLPNTTISTIQRSALTDGWETGEISNEQYSRKSFAKKIVGINRLNSKGFFTNTYPYDNNFHVINQYLSGDTNPNEYFRQDYLVDDGVALQHRQAQTWYQDAPNNSYRSHWYNKIFWDANRINIGSYNGDLEDNFVYELIIPRPQFSPGSSLGGNADTQYSATFNIPSASAYEGHGTLYQRFVLCNSNFSTNREVLSNWSTDIKNTYSLDMVNYKEDSRASEWYFWVQYKVVNGNFDSNVLDNNDMIVDPDHIDKDIQTIYLDKARSDLKVSEILESLASAVATWYTMTYSPSTNNDGVISWLIGNSIQNNTTDGRTRASLSNYARLGYLANRPAIAIAGLLNTSDDYHSISVLQLSQAGNSWNMLKFTNEVGVPDNITLNSDGTMDEGNIFNSDGTVNSQGNFLYHKTKEILDANNHRFEFAKNGTTIIYGDPGYSVATGDASHFTRFDNVGAIQILSYANSTGKYLPSRPLTREGTLSETRINDGNGNKFISKYSEDWKEGDNFGNSTTLSDNGTVIAVSMRKTDSGDDYGAVKVFRINSGFIGGTINGTSTDTGFGSAISLNANGTLLAISAPNTSGGGLVKVYRYDGTNWFQLGNDITLSISTGEEEFGSSLALSPDDNYVDSFLIVGAPKYNSDDTSIYEGAVAVYRWSNATDDWEQVQSFVGDKTYNGSNIGNGVAIGASHNLFISGNQYKVYSWDGTAFIQKGPSLGSMPQSVSAGEVISSDEVKEPEYSKLIDISDDGNIIAVANPDTVVDNDATTPGTIRILEWRN